MLRPNTRALSGLLGLLTMIGPFSTDMYIPSLPEMVRLLATTPANVQLTLSSYLIGFAVGQILYGPFSDRYGRKPVILVALAIYSLASLACAVTPSIETLIVARFFQAIGGSGVVVLARAIVRDLYSGARAARELAIMGAVMGFAPIVAPLVGALLQSHFGWRANFVLVIGFAIFLAVAVKILLPETLRQRAPERIALMPILGIYRMLLENRVFLAHLAILATAYSGLFAWISGSSFVLQDLYGLSPFAFGMAFSGSCIGYLLGVWIAARIVVRLGIDRTLQWGSLVFAIGGLLTMASVALDWRNGAALAVPVAIFLFGLGLILPQAMAGALSPFPTRGGAASSLMGFTQQTSAALLGVLLGHLLGNSAWPLALAIGGPGILTLVLWFATKDARAREATPS
ncbi:MAG: multidrug effflux MFS transporter [Pseudorhodoplanes sp.]